MDVVRQWAFSICTALVVCGIAQMILPHNNLEKVFRLTVSVFFLCCLLSPVVLGSPQLRIELEEYAQEEMELRARRLLDVVEEQSELAAASGVREIVEDKLLQMGINYTDITININTTGQSGPAVEAVDVVLDNRHEAQHGAIRRELENTLGMTVRLGYEEVENPQEQEAGIRRTDSPDGGGGDEND